jgi:pimeloyl-ACP methyl ester carboxylesterase
MSAAPLAITLDAWQGPDIAGVLLPAESAFSILFLHDEGRDLDSVSAAFHAPELADIRRIALDLPGHGLSGDCLPDERQAWLGRGLAVLAERRFAPFVIIGFGNSAARACRLATAAPTCGLVAVAPSGAFDLAAPPPRAIPLLAFVSGIEARAGEHWQRLRDSAGLAWTMISLPLPSAEIATPGADAAGIIASHLSGFARECYLR